jgi:putative oxidoreductase
MREAPPAVSLMLAGAAVMSGLLVLAGLWTPVAASVGALLELWIVVSRTGLEGTPIFLTAIAASLAMLGPGAWSVDARLFGRRRIDFPDQ